MRQNLLSWLSDLASAVGGSWAASHGDSGDGPRLRGSRRRSLRSFVLALACGLVLALLNGSAGAYRPGGGQSFAAPPPRPAPVASPRVSTPLLAPKPPSPAPLVVRPSGGWSIPTPAAPQAPTEEAAAAPDPAPAPPYQPSKSPTVFAVLMLVGGSAAVGLALVRSRASGATGASGVSGVSGNPWDVEHGVGNAPGGTAGSPGASVGPLPLMGDLVQGKYRVGRELERDELGVMFQGSHEHLNIPLRLYFLLPEHADSPVAQAQLWEMVRGWASTTDPNHRVADAGTMENGRLFVVLGA